RGRTCRSRDSRRSSGSSAVTGPGVLPRQDHALGRPDQLAGPDPVVTHRAARCPPGLDHARLLPELQQLGRLEGEVPRLGLLAAPVDRQVAAVTPRSHQDTSTKSSGACESRSAAFSHWSSRFSMPMARRPRSCAATRSVPDPVNIESKPPPGGQDAAMCGATIATGFSVSLRRWYRIDCARMTERARRVPSSVYAMAWLGRRRCPLPGRGCRTTDLSSVWTRSRGVAL